MGTVMSLQFGFGGFANAFLLAPLAQLMGGNVGAVVRNCVLIMCFIYSVQGFLYYTEVNVTLYPYVAMMMMLSIFQYSLGTAITAKTSTIVPKKMQGTLMGLEHSLFAVAYMVGPQVGVAGLAYGGVAGLSALCALIFATVLVVWAAFHQSPKGTAKQC